ncbi:MULTISPECIES: DeoR/GlpR family DNA-binding transcription regulator [Oxalobacteraceae]|uniref:DeoR/GlpR family DNA-binding transcription regulator n=1 Tax=Oxalobacteraceae TaxID=75682 RepID=UPI0010A305AA|nr:MULTISPECIES: DeoR/GlpR family DNA-binding transcription regulator [Oxalobacteraceae]HJV82419.1 DeoR/GlpR family DNA-binding transcription regulator [Noviherbaspirillum sp.]
MALNPRQRRLLEYVRTHETVSVEELAREFSVTSQTVRRDIKQMAEANLLARYHGGVGLASSVENIDYAQRQSLHVGAKRSIAAAVAQRVPEGCSLLINIGTTTEEVARALVNHQGLHVITNNLNVATILSDNPRSEVIIAGGVVRKRDRAVIGEATSDFIRQFKVDIGIIGISSIEADGTLRDFDPREVKVAQTIIEQSREVWLVADGDKFGREALVRMGHVSQVNKLFTDTRPPEALARILKTHAVEVIVTEAADRAA